MLALNYSDVYLSPRYSSLKSRSQADVSVEFLGTKFKSPIIPANMSSVINPDLAKWLSNNGYFYIMHRFADTFKFVQKANAEDWKTISISIGVKEEDLSLIRNIVNSNYRIDFITIDIAHGHSLLVKETIEFIKTIYSFKSFDYSWTIPKIIAGNVATREGVNDVNTWGADAVKVGIAGGGACSTKNMTGFHIPMFSCVKNCYEYNKDIPIIADGGVRENGDIPKALVAGATMVMVGGLLAACIDAPGENVYSKQEYDVVYRHDSNGYAIAYAQQPRKREITHKSYHGSASEHQKGEKKHVEGFKTQIPCNGLTYKEKYQELKESLSSAVSYAGGKDLLAFKSVDFVTIK